mgnify:CR=1 FL=1
MYLRGGCLSAQPQRRDILVTEGELDMTEQAAMTALAWLQDIEAVPVSLEDMGAYMQNLTVQVRLNMKQRTP